MNSYASKITEGNILHTCNRSKDVAPIYQYQNALNFPG